MIDFPNVKKRLMILFVQAIRARTLDEEPLLRQIPVQFQHEGLAGELIRADGSRAATNLDEHSTALTMSREEMRTPDLPGLLKKSTKSQRRSAESKSECF